VPQATWIPAAIVLIGALIAAVTDVWKYRVYNALTLPLMATGLLYHTITGGLPGLGDSALGLLIGFGSLVVLHLLGGVGAGDVKLMAGVGAWLGMKLTFYVFIASSLAAGVYAVALVVLTGRVGETLVNFQILMHRLASIGRFLGADNRLEHEVLSADRRRRLIPFGAMVAIGIICTFLYIVLNPE
jgi:prepilin peptidase CpaA